MSMPWCRLGLPLAIFPSFILGWSNALQTVTSLMVWISSQSIRPIPGLHQQSLSSRRQYSRSSDHNTRSLGSRDCSLDYVCLSFENHPEESVLSRIFISFFTLCTLCTNPFSNRHCLASLQSELAKLLAVCIFLCRFRDFQPYYSSLLVIKARNR